MRTSLRRSVFTSQPKSVLVCQTFSLFFFIFILGSGKPRSHARVPPHNQESETAYGPTLDIFPVVWYGKVRHKKNAPEGLERFGKDLGRIWETYSCGRYELPSSSANFSAISRHWENMPWSFLLTRTMSIRRASQSINESVQILRMLS